MAVLVVNAGSSSLKVAAFDAGLARTHALMVAEIGGAARLADADGTRAVAAADHVAALTVILDRLAETGLPLAKVRAAGHRVVHGGAGLTQPVQVTDDTLAAIDACVPLAPLHNPANLAAIRALARLAPDLPQVACFDTAFHATNPDVAVRYAIPEAEYQKGIRRYGFHGISFESLTARLPALTGRALPARLLAFHLGNGASLCAIRDGRSVATTMGYSPLDGLTMGTRSGSIDGNAVLRLAADHGIDGAARILNHESGLLALGRASDMRALRAARTPEARFAIDHFCYWAVRHAGSMIAAMGGIDAIAFTGGIGENDPHVRAAILKGLTWTGLDADWPANRQSASRLHEDGSPVAAWIVPADEETWIAAATRACLRMADD